MRLLAPVLLLLWLTGCATLFTGTKDNVTFNTKPEGAQVLINGIPRGFTPATIQIERPGFGATNLVVIKKEGYKDISFAITKSFNAISIINLALIFGWAIDAVSGSIMKNDPTNYDLSMEQYRAQAAKQLDTAAVAFLHELPRDEHGTLVLPEHNGKQAIVDPQRGVAVITE